jgi:DNA polymerase-3 subunit epsilon
MAAALLGQIQHDLRSRYSVRNPDHALLMALQRCAKPAVSRLMAQYTQSGSDASC